MDTLHQVAKEELPTLVDWLERYLPETFKTAPYHMDPRNTSVFSPSPAHLKRLLTWPGYLDWTKPILFHVFSSRLVGPVIQELSESRGGNPVRARRLGRRLFAKSGDVPLLPVPENLEARELDPDLHTDMVVSNWTHSRRHSDLYIRELLTRFPSVGLFDASGRCVAYEIGKYIGTIGFLHVEEDFRGRGLGKVVTSLLAHKYFSQGRPVSVLVFVHNELALGMHSKLGFKMDGELDVFTHYMGDPEDNEEILNFA